jgi:hypothetical protein
MTTPVVQLSVGDTVPLGTILANVRLMGIVTDPTTPNMVAGTLEMFGDQGVLTVPVLQGPPGVQGAPQFALMFQNDNLSAPADLPNDLTNTDADIGKYWIFATVDSNGNITGTTAYIWYGTEYRQLPMGSQGPPGPYPVITPVVDLIDSDLTSYVTVSGPTSNPQWQLNLAVPAGPPGPSASLSACPDVNLSTPPSLGQVLGFNGQYTLTGAPIFQPMDIGDIMPRPYTIPESAFTSYSGISSSTQTICTWQAPAQQWPWQPWVSGQVQGLEGSLDISFNPSLIGVEVRLNDPNTGPLLASGVGNSDGSVTFIPHTSTPGSPSTAMSPTNGYAQVAAGTAPTIYVNLVNEGLATIFNYTSAGSQMGMVAYPVGTEQALPTTYFGTFTSRVGVTATWELISGS